MQGLGGIFLSASALSKTANWQTMVSLTLARGVVWSAAGAHGSRVFH
jgi:hypothetical protein